MTNNTQLPMKLQRFLFEVEKSLRRIEFFIVRNCNSFFNLSKHKSQELTKEENQRLEFGLNLAQDSYNESIERFKELWKSDLEHWDWDEQPLNNLYQDYWKRLKNYKLDEQYSERFKELLDNSLDLQEIENKIKKKEK